MGHLDVCAELGRASRARAIDAPPPSVGEHRRTAIPDSFDGIRFEIGRMIRYVQAARTDPLIVDAARTVGVQYAKYVEELSRREGRPLSAHNNKTLMLEGLDLWCRAHFCYVNDPPGKEIVQTANRMIRKTRVAREVLEYLMEPFYRAMEESVPELMPRDYEPPPVFEGDCDEGCVILCSLCACLDISPVRFAFGGNEGTLHHVWGRVYADGNWYDSDLTEPGYKLGDISAFDNYDEVEIPL